MRYPSDISNKILNEYGPEQADEIHQLFAKFNEDFRKIYDQDATPRLIRCILHLAKGNKEDIKKYSDCGLKDWRDIIYWAEYDKNDKWINDYNLPFA